MTELHIDSSTREIRLSAELVGEDQPLDATVRYDVVEEGDKTFIVPLQVTTSRQWLTLLADEMIRKQPVRIEVPAGIAATALRILKI